MKEDVLLGLCLVQSLCSSGARVRVAEKVCWVYVHKATFGFGDESA